MECCCVTYLAIGLPALLALLYCIYKFTKSGFFDAIHAKITSPPFPFNGKSITIYYKFKMGAYRQHVGAMFDELKSMVSKNVHTLGIYYSDPRVSFDSLVIINVCFQLVSEGRQQFAVGVVTAVDSIALLSDQHCDRLKARGYKQMQLPGIRVAVCAEHRFTAWMPFLLSIFQYTTAYGTIHKCIENNGIKAGPMSIELYDNIRTNGGVYHYIWPMENSDAFYVAEHVKE